MVLPKAPAKAEAQPDKVAGGKVKKPKKPKAPRTPKVKKDAASMYKRKNFKLGNGVYLYNAKRNKTALHKFAFRKRKRAVFPQKPLTVTKPIGGEKNGGSRVVLLKKRRPHFPTAERMKARPSKKKFSEHKRSIRKSLTPGTIVILLNGAHKGKRVIFLKQLASGLLLVNGPMKVNRCPLRRVQQSYVIATKTKIDISGIEIPANIDDKYFKRIREKRPKKEDGDIFNKKKTKYVPSAQRKADQKIVDKLCTDVIRKLFHKKERYTFYAYLKNMFGLHSSQYPHRMVF